MEVTLRGLDIEMAQQVLDITDIRSLIKQMGGKTMLQTVRQRIFGCRLSFLAFEKIC